MAPFPLRMASREWRHALRRLGVYMASITVGVAALVALHSFRDDVVRSIQSENRALLGADARLSGNRPAPDSVQAVVDSLVALGADAARVTSLVSMALADESGRTRLVQVRGVEPGFPFYGEADTDPAGLWDELSALPDGADSPDEADSPGGVDSSGGAAPPDDATASDEPAASGDRPMALVDPSLLAQLDMEVGQGLRLGSVEFEVAGTVEGLPTDVGLQTAVGPRVFVAFRHLGTTGLLARGSLARHHVYLRLPAGVDPDEVEEAREDVLRATGTWMRTPEEQARSLTRSADFLADFLALVGLAALLLGGVGVGSAVAVYVRGKLDAVALLRCLGATRRQVFATYLLQAAAIGFLGSAVGVAGGLAAQRWLPLLIRDVLPVPVAASISPGSVAFGLLLGTWVAAVFALVPLLRVRRVAPLQALRHVAETPSGADPARWGAVAAVAATVLALTLFEAPSPAAGLAFAAGLAAVAGVLWSVAWGLAWATRRFFPRQAAYAVRQGVANLFRPGNQTVAVTLALGFGVLVVGVIVQLQRNLVRELSFGQGPDGFNMLVFDVQPEQEDGVRALVEARAEGDATPVPVVTTRIASVKGRAVGDILADSAREDRPPRWVLRQEHRATYRPELKANETILAGEWWHGAVGAEDADSAAAPARVSVEEELAEDLRVGVGDEIVWMVGGVEYASVVANVRDVDWAGFDANFLAVFEPGAMEDAPRTTVFPANMTREEERLAFQEELVRQYPNVSVLDLFTVRSTVEAILSRVVGAIRILAGLCTVAGLVVMAGSMASTRAQRRLEGALLRTLGARFRQIRWILLSEYAALGSLAALAGGVLSLAASWLLASGLFGISYRPATGAAAMLWLAVVGLVVVAGAVGGRGPARSGPLAVLREAE